MKLITLHDINNGTETVINPKFIMSMRERASDGTTFIMLRNERSFYVEEDIDEIKDLINGKKRNAAGNKKRQPDHDVWDDDDDDWDDDDDDDWDDDDDDDWDDDDDDDWGND